MRTNCSSTTGWNAYTSLLSFPNLVDAFRYDTIVAAQLEVYNYQADTCSSRRVGCVWRDGGLAVDAVAESEVPRSANDAVGDRVEEFLAWLRVESTGTTACQPTYDEHARSTRPGVSWLQSLVDGQRSNFGFAMFANQRTDRFSWKKFAGINTANPPKLAVTHSPYHASYAFRKQNPADYVTQDQAGKFPMTITNLGGFTWQPGDDYMSYRVFKNGQLVRTVPSLATPVTTSVPHGGKINLDVAVGALPGTPWGSTIRSSSRWCIEIRRSIAGTPIGVSNQRRG